MAMPRKYTNTYIHSGANHKCNIIILRAQKHYTSYGKLSIPLFIFASLNPFKFHPVVEKEYTARFVRK